MFLLRSDTAATPPLRFRGDGESVLDAQLSPDSHHLMALYENGAVRVWNTRGNRLVFLLQDDSTKVVRALLSPKGTYVLTSSDDGVSQLWRTEDGLGMMRFSGYDHQISEVCFTHDERYVISGTEDGTIYIWETRNSNNFVERRGQQGNPITSIDVARDNSKVVTVSYHGRSIVVWDIKSGMPLAFDAQNEENRPMRVTFDPSGEYLVVPTIHGLGETRVLKRGSWPCSKWWDSIHLLAGRLEGMEDREEFPILAMDETLEGDWGNLAAFSPDGRTLAILHQSSTIILWDWPSRKRRHSIEHQDDLLTRISFSADSRYLITAPNVPAQIIPDGSEFNARISRIYDVSDGTEALVLLGHNDLVMSAQLAVNGESIMTASKDGDILIWDTGPEAIANLRAGGDTSPIVATLRADAARASAEHEDGPQLLISAARAGRTGDLSTLLAAGADPDTKADGTTPVLLEAALHGQIDTVKALLEYGADINQANESGQTALNLAVLLGNEEMVRHLLDHDPNIDAQQESTGTTALHDAVRSESLEISKQLLESGADPNTIFKQQEEPFRTSVAVTALMQATEQGDLRLVRLLLQHGAQPDASNEPGQTALHIATKAGSVDLVQLLLDASANPEPDASNARSPLNIAIDQRNSTIIDLLLAAGAKMTVESRAATSDLYEIAKKGGHLAVVEQLLEQGANPVKVVKSDFTPLHMAAMNGHTELVEAMLRKCTDVDIKLGSGATPLVSAAAAGHTQIVADLLKAGADPSAQTSFGETALKGAIRNRHGETIIALLEGGAPFEADSESAADLLVLAAKEGLASLAEKLISTGVTVSDSCLPQAAENGHGDVVDLFLAAGADVDSLGDRERTPLMLAIQGDHSQIVETLLRYKADVNTRDYMGRSALHFAAAGGRVSYIDPLLGAQADIDRNDNQIRKPLYLAADTGHVEFVKALSDRGADIDSAQYSGWTPLHAAVNNNHVDVVRVLLEAGARWDQLANEADPDSGPANLSKSPEMNVLLASVQMPQTGTPPMASAESVPTNDCGTGADDSMLERRDAGLEKSEDQDGLSIWIFLFVVAAAVTGVYIML